ncbi:dynein light chain Tctex-type protein 2B isoform X1 [Serinus canaria]|uniref:dynein light chain Tctex-type protein 2B isoform X1 n=1 Tax=Serinus canaria TaxID=9135 RepID=UPI0021CCAA06|nr:dynein light chain Tctex-type protein 2B isoform X1 [Serinus canaria]
MGELGPEEGPENTYSLRPDLQHRFKSSTVKECIRAILKEKLANVQYIPEEMPELTKSLSDTIKDRLKEEGFDRYKMVVQVVIGEQRGEGVKTACFVWWLHLAASTIEGDKHCTERWTLGRMLWSTFYLSAQKHHILPLVHNTINCSMKHVLHLFYTL